MWSESKKWSKTWRPRSYVGFSLPARFLRNTQTWKTAQGDLGLHWSPCLSSLGDQKISLQIYIYRERERELTGHLQYGVISMIIYTSNNLNNATTSEIWKNCKRQSFTFQCFVFFWNERVFVELNFSLHRHLKNMVNYVVLFQALCFAILKERNVVYYSKRNLFIAIYDDKVREKEYSYSPFQSCARGLVIARLTMHHGIVLGKKSPSLKTC